MDLFYVYLVFFVELTIEKTVAQPPPSLPTINPGIWDEDIGKDIQLNCTAPNATSITWRRSGNEPLKASATQINGILIIEGSTPSDSGVYVCSATTLGGVETSRDVSVTVSNTAEITRPTVEVELTPPEHSTTHGTRKLSDNSAPDGIPALTGNETVAEQGLDLRISSNDQVINESRAVVFQCRDKSPIRTAVHWMREDGAPLPPGSTDENGKLEIPNVQVVHSGNYVCEALGVPENTPGRRVVAHLTVQKEGLTSRSLKICESDEATCSNGDCIPKSKVCDGEYDCTDGTDEIRCGKFAVHDTILKVESSNATACSRGTFNSVARTADECISCFCSGAATECSSAKLFTYHLPAVFDQYNVVSVNTYPKIRIQEQASENAPEVRPVAYDGVQINHRHADSDDPNNVLYFALPKSYHGSQLKSYGGYLKYTVRYGGRGSPNSAPDVIISGNNYVLIHKGGIVSPNYEIEKSVRLFFGDWTRKQGWDNVTASREEIMMTLANVDNILIKVKYDDGPINTTISNVLMDTAGVVNTNQGAATFVEECRCPVGYTGLSCEHCASGYFRQDSGPWSGKCYEDKPKCQPGYYQDPERNLPCQHCPCPLTTPSNQFARSCHLGSDRQPTCDCPEGYLGRRCERCAPGYEGHPLVIGESCVKVDECDPNGSISPYPDPLTGVCRCKQLAAGRTCNRCKANTFNLAKSNKFGCVRCFCMGISTKCASSNWYRSKIHVPFNSSIRDFSLVMSKSTDPIPIVDGIYLNKISREIVYDTFPNPENVDVYYWQLPRDFLGDQIASYSGNLEYTVRNVPSPGIARSGSNASDVELISSNDMNLHHYSGKELEPNRAETFTVPLLEDYWQHSNGTTVKREHLLMALADILAIRIKATYTTHTDEAALSSVSLDTAVNSKTGKARAVEVEACSCPAGYRGLSCEDCDVGYTRGDSDLYLGTCVACNCNGHSAQCDPESGICEYCKDHTTGDHCEICEFGYGGDATRGTSQDCRLRNNTSEPPCTCDSVGSIGTDCYGGQCRCKTNVEGLNCSQCRQSTFGLSPSNVDGCIECYCSGVTNECHESSYYITQIASDIYNYSNGFTLIDSVWRRIIFNNIIINTTTNEIGYRYPDARSQMLFWSLPSHITGNQVRSYGGKLYVTQQIITRAGSVSKKDRDVILIGGEIILYWQNPEDIQSGTPLTYSVPLVESSWTRVTVKEGSRSASRAELMSVLSNLKAILVRATYSLGMKVTYISNVSLDTAVSQPASSNRATQVEACRCPPGYTGTSCESCAYGYYRDFNNKSLSLLGSCNICPCNGNEMLCKISASRGVKCLCLPGYTGRHCSKNEYPPTTSETLLNITTYVGSSVQLDCSAASRSRVNWSRERGDILKNSYRLGNVLKLTEVKSEDSGRYICRITNETGSFSSYYIGLRVDSPTVLVNMSIWASQDLVNIGDTIDVQCAASGALNPRIEWIKLNATSLPQNVRANGTVLTFSNIITSNSGIYRCEVHASNGWFTKDYLLTIQGGRNDTRDDKTKLALYGSTVVMDCHAEIDPPIKYQWHKVDGGLLNNNQTSGRQLKLLDVKVEDAGKYICLAENGQDNIEDLHVLFVTAVVPSFDQAPESYLSFPPIPDASSQFNIEVSFKPEIRDGIILYNGQNSNRAGDFILLSLDDGYPEFRFNLGSDTAIIKGQTKITRGKWHTIKLLRDGKNGTMYVDDEEPYVGKAEGELQILSLREPLYVGGVPDYKLISPQARVNSGFVGCISRLIIGGNQLDLNADYLSKVGIISCEICAENPCGNHGVCREAATKVGYICL